jgi:hypothetical protein
VLSATFAKASHRMGGRNYLELLRALKGTLSRWFQLHYQSFAPFMSRGAHVRQAAGRNIHNIPTVNRQDLLTQYVKILQETQKTL